MLKVSSAGASVEDMDSSSHSPVSPRRRVVVALVKAISTLHFMAVCFSLSSEVAAIIANELARRSAEIVTRSVVAGITALQFG